MRDAIDLTVNGHSTEVLAGTSVAAAILLTRSTFRRSVTSAEPRGPLCGMGTCFECRATVNGHTQQRTCQMPCVTGMIVTTDE